MRTAFRGTLVAMAATALVWLGLGVIPASSVVKASDPVRCNGCVGTSDLANGAVTTGKLATNAVTSPKIKDGTVSLKDLGFDPATQAEMEARVGRPAYSMKSFQTANTDGDQVSVAIGVDGLADVAQRDSTASNVQFTRCLNLTCTAASSRILASVGTNGGNPSVAIGPGGFPLVSFIDGAGLELARCSNVSCGSDTVSNVDSFTPSNGDDDSLAMGSDGDPAILFSHNTGVQFAHCDSVTCPSPDIRNVAVSSSGSGSPSLTMSAAGLPIGIFHNSGSHLSLMNCDDSSCASRATHEIDGTSTNVGLYGTVTVGTDGFPIAAYWDLTNSKMKVVHCTAVACGTNDTPVALDDSMQGDSAIAIGDDGMPIISYREKVVGPTRIKVAHCTSVACSAATSVETGPPAGVSAATSSSAAIGPDGLPLIALTANDDLGMLHCSNVFCVPFFQRR